MSQPIDRWIRLLAHLLLWVVLTGSLAARAAAPLCDTDIDGNGSAAPASDGQLLLRHLFGFTGDRLITDAVGPGCTRCTAEAIATHLETVACQVLFDIDGDGIRGALTDGLLLLRHLTGLTGIALTQGALGLGAVRTDPESLSGWLSLGVLPPGGSNSSPATRSRPTASTSNGSPPTTTTPTPMPCGMSSMPTSRQPTCPTPRPPKPRSSVPPPAPWPA